MCHILFMNLCRILLIFSGLLKGGDGKYRPLLLTLSACPGQTSLITLRILPAEAPSGLTALSWGSAAYTSYPKWAAEKRCFISIMVNNVLFGYCLFILSLL